MLREEPRITDLNTSNVTPICDPDTIVATNVLNTSLSRNP